MAQRAYVRVFELCIFVTEPKTHTAEVPGVVEGGLEDMINSVPVSFLGGSKMSILIVLNFQDTCLWWETQSPSAGPRSRHRGGVGAH